MEDSNLRQVAVFASPFPSEIYKNELLKAGIDFKEQMKGGFAEGSDQAVFFVSSEDMERALEIRERVDTEDAVSKEKHKKPIQKYAQYLALTLFLAFVTYKIIEFLMDNVF